MDENIEMLEEDAIQLAVEGDWKQAIKVNKQIIKHGHKKPAVYNRLGKAYSELEMWDEAVKSFEHALKLDPINAVAQKGLNNAKMDRKAGIKNLKAHEETLLRDTSTSTIVEIVMKNANVDKEFTLVKGGKDFYLFVEVESGNKVRRISKSKLNFKQDAEPKELRAIVIEEIKDGLVKVKLTSKDPVFRSSKQEIDPSLALKRKEILAEKREIEKYMDEEREEE